MLKGFLMKQLMKRKMSHLPPEMQERFSSAIEKDPDFFTMLSKEIDAEQKRGKGQMAASISVMKKHQKRLQELLS
jgi:hypothetical protein